MMFNYKWYLNDGYPAKGIEYHGAKVFGTFICGGGSTMGYKLAGYHHLGGVELDEQVAKGYRVNHSPEHLYTEDLRLFNQRADLPDELYQLDILDGSPPCSTFSMAGSREKAWGKDKVFREGQAKQILDDLVFVYCETINKLQPKIAILENVKGIIGGNAKAYSIAIQQRLNNYGYDVQVFLLNAAFMGVPQKRERVFFIARRKDLKLPKLVLNFNERPIVFGEVVDKEDKTSNLIGEVNKIWEFCERGDRNLGASHERMDGKLSYFGSKIQYLNDVCYTVIGSSGSPIIIYDYKRYLNDKELKQVGSYPMDYDFCDLKPKYLIGMSVPPVMMAQLANQIYKQWLRSLA